MRKARLLLAIAHLFLMLFLLALPASGQLILNSGLTSATDFTGSFQCIWDFSDAGTGTLNTVSGTVGSGSGCALTENNSPVSSGTSLDGNGSIDFEDASNQYARGTDANVGTTLDTTGDLSVICLGQMESVAQIHRLVWKQSTGGFGLMWQLAATRFEFSTHDGTSGVVAVTSSYTSAGTWFAVGGTHDVTATENRVYLNGAWAAAGGTAGLADTTQNMDISSGDSVRDYDGLLDWCGVAHGEFTDIEFDRMASCGYDGSRCLCNGDGTYNTTGDASTLGITLSGTECNASPSF